jgi:hypothetical protein
MSITAGSGYRHGATTTLVFALLALAVATSGDILSGG